MADPEDFVILTNLGCFRIIVNKGKLTLFIANNIGDPIKEVKRKTAIVLEPKITNILGCTITTTNRRVYEVLGVYQRIA